MLTKKALIEWIPKGQGGRTQPPLGLGNPPHATVLHFTDEPWPHTAGSWSLAVAKIESMGDEYRWLPDVRFLVEEAPHDSLREGRAFELYEGRKCVARGTVLSEAAARSKNPVKSESSAKG